MNLKNVIIFSSINRRVNCNSKCHFFMKYYEMYCFSSISYISFEVFPLKSFLG